VKWRAGHIALIVFQAIWLNVILPGHTRGVVTLPGTERPQTRAAREGCCARKKSKDPAPESSSRASRCAICFFAMRLTTPPVVDLRPPAMSLLESIAPPAPARFVSFHSRLTYLGRAPPTV
jgi:hypothetical protein